MESVMMERIRIANKLGLEGTRVTGWVEPKDGTQDAIGTPIIDARITPIDATEAQ